MSGVTPMVARRGLEQQLVGSLLAGDTTFDQVPEELTYEHFNDLAARNIFRAQRELHEKKERVRADQVIAHLQEIGRLASVSWEGWKGEAAVKQLAIAEGKRGGAAHIPGLARKILAARRREKQAQVGKEAVARIEQGEDPQTAIAPLVALATNDDSALPNAWSSRLVTVSANWLTEAPPPRRYLMRDIRTGKGAIPARGVCLLVAAGGAGKSYASVAATIALATGTPWLGAFQPENKGRVLIVSAEEPADELRARIYHVAKVAGVDAIPEGSIDIIDVHDVHMPLLDRFGTPNDTGRDLVTLVRRRGPYALVIVDPLARLSGASIDADNVAACALVTALEAVASAADGLVLGSHHTSQAARRNSIVDATAIRGATGLGDSARMVLVLGVETIDHADPEIEARLGEIVTLTRAKANHVGRWEPVRMRRGPQGVLVPLDQHDSAMISEAKKAADPVAKKTADKQEKSTQHVQAVMVAVRAVLSRSSEGLGYRELRAGARANPDVQRFGGCGDPLLDVAIVRLGEELRIVSGPRGSKIHTLASRGGVQ